MTWVVEFFDAFEAEFDAFPDEVQDAILARAALSSGKARSLADRTPIPCEAPGTRT